MRSELNFNLLTKIALGILAFVLTNCQQKPRTNVVRTDHGLYELAVNEITDSVYAKIMDNTRTFVLDSMNRNPKDFKYSLLQTMQDGNFRVVIELYDKMDEVYENDPFSDSTVYIRLNHAYELHFDSTGAYLFNMWVADTLEEQLESGDTFETFD